MLASNFIKKLEKLIEKNGDLRIVIREETIDGFNHNEDICVMEYKDVGCKKFVIS